MNKETFEKAKSLNKQIEKLENHIYAINGTIITGNSILKRDTKVGFFAKLRLINSHKEKSNQKEASVILFDNDMMHVGGYYDIDVDKEFLEYLSKYFENKKDELEIELENL